MKKLRWLGLLMMIAIIVITGFQAWWLKQTYDREEKTLELKTQTAFVSTIHHLQAVELKLGKFFPDSLAKDQRIIVRGNEEEKFDPGTIRRDNVVITVNALQNEMKDSLEKIEARRSEPIIPGKKISVFYKKDSMKILTGFDYRKRQKDFAYVFLTKLDSLQDSLKVKEISTAYSKTLKEQRTEVPFIVERNDSVKTFPIKPVPNEVTLGFKHPITYKMQLGNTFPYLMKQITPPIIFSLFLVGVTVLSFLLLYRSLVRQRRLAILKNEFISNITHELKTPIATVGVAIEALKNFNAIQDPQRTKEYLDISSNELQRLSLLVDKVLKLSMFEKKEIELKFENVNLKEVVDEVVTSMRLQLEKYHAKISVTNEGDLNLSGDRLHLLSVVFNLLDNALKYSKENLAIQIDLKEINNDVVMSVTDNGIGIPPEYKDKIFEKFFRVPTGDTHNAKGYGLGLSYVAQVVQKHAGTISVESNPGIGSKFVITLPKQQS